MVTQIHIQPYRIAQIGDGIVLDSLTVAAAECQSLKEFEDAGLIDSDHSFPYQTPK